MKACHTFKAGRPHYTSANQGILTAVLIATRFRDTPSICQLMTDFDMSKATAYRWRSAFRIAKGESAGNGGAA